MNDQTLRVLLIEDDVGDAILVERSLEQCTSQFTLKHCERLGDAIEAMRENDFDVALLDLSLPDSFGISALNRIRPQAPNMPIVVLTGLSDDDLALQFLEQGAQDYIVKANATSQLLERTLRYAVQRQQIQTENHRLLQEMEKLARHDALTGVLNRHSFAENLEIEWHRAKRYRRPLACVLLDIDFFKRVNDTFGHSTGDRVLKKVAETLCQNVRPSDIVGRLGGEEFCVLLPEINEENAEAWAERIRKEIAQLVFPNESNEVRVTVSLGVACRDDDLTKPQLLVDRADEAMFVAKQLGRNQFVRFNSLREQADNDHNQVWSGISVEKFMSPLLVSLTPSHSVGDAIDLMQSEQVDSIPVLNINGELVGVIGEEDIMAAILSSDVSDRGVGDLMKKQLVTYSAATPSREVCEFLCRAAVRQVFIVAGKKPVGVIRRSNFLRSVGQSTSGPESKPTTSFSRTISALSPKQNTALDGLSHSVEF